MKIKSNEPFYMLSATVIKFSLHPDLKPSIQVFDGKILYRFFRYHVASKCTKF